MSSLCFAGDGVTASLFASALHLAWTGADDVAREQSWHVWQDRFEFFAERRLEGGEWQHSWPERAPQARLMLDRFALRKDYLICGEGWCLPLERLVPRSRAAMVQISPC